MKRRPAGMPYFQFERHGFRDEFWSALRFALGFIFVLLAIILGGK